MLFAYLFETDDSVARKKVNATIETALKKNPDAFYARFSEENTDDINFNELLETQALFKREYIIFLDGVTSKIFDEFKNVVDDLRKSSHVFIVLDSFLRCDKRLLEKAANNITVFEDRHAEKKREFNIFSVSDAFAEKNFTNTFTLIESAILNGVREEEVITNILWTLDAIATSKNVPFEKSGMKLFVYNKFKNISDKWTNDEIRSWIKFISTVRYDASLMGMSARDILEKRILEGVDNLS